MFLAFLYETLQKSVVFGILMSLYPVSSCTSCACTHIANCCVVAYVVCVAYILVARVENLEIIFKIFVDSFHSLHCLPSHPPPHTHLKMHDFRFVLYLTACHCPFKLYRSTSASVVVEFLCVWLVSPAFYGCFNFFFGSGVTMLHVP